MDVICAGMYRACSTWQYGVVAELIERHRGGERLGYVEGADYRPSGDPERWRVLKCHDRHPNFARAIRRGRAVAVYAHRDIRDVVDSMRHTMGRSFEELMAEGLVHRILINDRFWSSQPGALIQRYDELRDDPERGIEAIARHLGVDLEPGEAHAIAERHAAEANRKRAARAFQNHQGGPTPHDPETLLHGNHLRDGRSGRWVEAFDARRLAILGRLAGGWLVERGYEPDRSWAPRRSVLEIGPPALRSAWHALVYFEARRRPRLASALKRLLRRPSPRPVKWDATSRDALPTAQRSEPRRRLGDSPQGNQKPEPIGSEDRTPHPVDPYSKAMQAGRDDAVNTGPLRSSKPPRDDHAGADRPRGGDTKRGPSP